MIRACPSCGRSNRIPVSKLDRTAKCGECKTALLPLDAPVEIGAPDSFDDLVGSSPLPVLVDFWAPWCGPCRVIAPELEKLARERAGRVVVAKLNTDELPSVASRYGIQGIPTMILFRDGAESQRVSGAMPGSAIASRLGL